jgi:restriction endonuclease S subunit
MSDYTTQKSRSMKITKKITIKLKDDQIELLHGISTLHEEIAKIYEDKVEACGGQDVTAFLKQIEVMLR